MTPFDLATVIFIREEMWSERITPKCRRRSVPRDKLKLADMKKWDWGVSSWRNIAALAHRA
jgi:hypothetical protein